MMSQALLLFLFMEDKFEVLVAAQTRLKLKQIYAAILKTSKINDLFQNHQIYSRWIFEISWSFHDMVSVTNVLRQSEM